VYKIAPLLFPKLRRNRTTKKKDRVMRSMMTMKKLDIKQIQEAAAQE